MGTKPSQSANVSTIHLCEIGDDRHLKAKDVLRAAGKAKLDDVLIIGRADNGELEAWGTLNAGQSLWLLEKLKERILSGSPWGLV